MKYDDCWCEAVSFPLLGRKCIYILIAVFLCREACVLCSTVGPVEGYNISYLAHWQSRGPEWRERYVKVRRTIESDGWWWMRGKQFISIFHFHLSFFGRSVFIFRAVEEIFLSGIDVFEFSNLLQFVSVASPGQQQGRGARCWLTSGFDGFRFCAMNDVCFRYQFGARFIIFCSKFVEQ